MDINSLFTEGKTSITKEEFEAWIKKNKLTSLEGENGEQKYVGIEKFLKLKNENKELEAQFENSKKVNDDYMKQLEALKNGSITKEDMDKKISEIQAEYKNNLDKLNADAENFKKDTLIKEALRSYNIQEGALEFVVSKLDKEIIKVNDKGEIIGLKDQMNSIMENNKFAFNVDDKIQYSTPNASNISGSRGALKFSDDPAEYDRQLQELQETNPTMYEQHMRDIGLIK